MPRRYATYICGGDYRPGPRDTCPDPVHDWPLPAGYSDASEVAEARLRRRWHNVPCGRCGLYGWRPARIDPKTDHPRPSRGGDRQVSQDKIDGFQPCGKCGHVDFDAAAGYRASGYQRAIEALRAHAEKCAGENKPVTALDYNIAADFLAAAAEQTPTEDNNGSR